MDKMGLVISLLGLFLGGGFLFKLFNWGVSLTQSVDDLKKAHKTTEDAVTQLQESVSTLKTSMGQQEKNIEARLGMMSATVEQMAVRMEVFMSNTEKLIKILQDTHQESVAGLRSAVEEQSNRCMTIISTFYAKKENKQ